MKLEVGEFYLSAGGEIIEINFFNKFSMFEDINCNTYFENGKCDGDCREFDLIAHIPKELHWSIVSQVYSYYQNINARNKIVRRHKNFFNKKKIIIPS